MKAGALRHLIAIEGQTSIPNSYGEPVATWGTVATVWASREDLTGRESFQAQQAQSEVTTRFTIRHLDGLTAKMRIVDDTTIYDVESVQDTDGRSRELILMAKRVT